MQTLYKVLCREIHGSVKVLNSGNELEFDGLFGRLCFTHMGEHDLNVVDYVSLVEKPIDSHIIRLVTCSCELFAIVRT